ncbi:adenylyl cyclase [Baffinella frigidus]|nr:adenylyl cyclase [Cryptophyta sp. CCMP2293]
MMDLLSLIYARFDQLCVHHSVEKGLESKMMDLLSLIYARFDQLCVHHSVEKVTSLGETYTCAVGLDAETSQDAALALLQMALQMRRVVGEIGGKKGNPYVSVRIGIHAGDMVGGVVDLQAPRFSAVRGNVIDVAQAVCSLGLR